MDFKVEVEICLSNAMGRLKAQGCTERDFFAGKCLGIEEVIRIEEKCRG